MQRSLKELRNTYMVDKGIYEVAKEEYKEGRLEKGELPIYRQRYQESKEAYQKAMQKHKGKLRA